MDSKHAYQIKMQFLLKEWNVRLQELEEKADQIAGDQKDAFGDALEKLAAKKEEFASELAKFKESQIEPWTDLKASLNQTAKKVEDAFNQALARN